MYNDKTLPSSVYTKLSANRQPYIDRAQDASLLTIPNLFPMDGYSKNYNIETSFQSIGSRGVNHLSAKLLLSLLPPNSPFFRLTIEDNALAELNQNPEAKAEIMSIIGQIERRIHREIELKALRPAVHDALKQLIVAGNTLLYLPKKGMMRVYPITQYVVSRDPAGNILCIVTVEHIAEQALSQEMLDAIDKKEMTEYKGDKCHKLYTMVHLASEGKYNVCQEIGGVILPKSKGTYNEDTMPFHPLRWSIVNGDDYGRGMIEEYMGDLVNVEYLSKSINDGALASARVIGLVNPSSTTSLKDLNDVVNGGFIIGQASDISFLQVNKAGDLQVAATRIMEVTKRLEAAFLLSSSVTRNAERVTAEEIRLLANELEATLGGVYAILSQTLQLPLVKGVMRQLQDSGTIPAFKGGLSKAIIPAIVGGIDSLSRGNDLQKLMQFVNLAALGLPSEINRVVFLSEAATAIGLDIKGLIKSPTQLAEEAEAARQAALQSTLLNKATGPAISALGANPQLLSNQALSPQ